MDLQLERTALLSQYRTYLQILHAKGLVFQVISDEELEKLPLQDLSDLVKRVRDLSRTPTS